MRAPRRRCGGLGKTYRRIRRGESAARRVGDEQDHAAGALEIADRLGGIDVAGNGLDAEPGQARGRNERLVLGMFGEGRRHGEAVHPIEPPQHGGIERHDAAGRQRVGEERREGLAPEACRPGHAADENRRGVGDASRGDDAQAEGAERPRECQLGIALDRTGRQRRRPGVGRRHDHRAARRRAQVGLTLEPDAASRHALDRLERAVGDVDQRAQRVLGEALRERTADAEPEAARLGADSRIDPLPERRHPLEHGRDGEQIDLDGEDAQRGQPSRDGEPEACDVRAELRDQADERLEVGRVLGRVGVERAAAEAAVRLRSLDERHEPIWLDHCRIEGEHGAAEDGDRVHPRDARLALRQIA